MGRVKNFLLIACGWMSLALAVVGIFLPLLPTTPLVILAGYCFSKGSDRLHQWLLRRKTFGPMLLQWEQYGVISKKAKILSVGMIVPLFTYTMIFVPIAWWIKLIVLAVGVWVVWFILSRPSEPKTLT